MSQQPVDEPELWSGLILPEGEQPDADADGRVAIYRGELGRVYARLWDAAEVDLIEEQAAQVAARGVQDVTLDATGRLLITLLDGTVLDAGDIVNTIVSVQSAQITAARHLRITLTDGRVIDAGQLPLQSLVGGTLTAPNGAKYTVGVSNTGVPTATALQVPAPTNLTAARGANGVTLTWTAGGTGLTYRVSRAGQQIATGVTATTYLDAAAPGHSVSYSVVAVHSDGRVSSAVSVVSWATLAWSDDFNRANTTAADLGRPGVYTQPLWSTSVRLQLVSNAVTVLTTNSRSVALLETGSGDVELEYTLTTSAGGVFRFVSAEDYYYLSATGLHRRLSGVITTLASWTTRTGSYRVVVAGATTTVYYNGAQLATYTSTVSSTATRHGFQVTTGTLDTFSISPAPVMVPPTNLAITGMASAQTLTWTASPMAATYRVLRNGQLVAQDVTGTTFTDDTTGLTGTLTYSVIGVEATTGRQSAALTGTTTLPVALPFRDDFARANETPLTTPWRQLGTSNLDLVSQSVSRAAGGTGIAAAAVSTGTPDIDVTYDYVGGTDNGAVFRADSVAGTHYLVRQDGIWFMTNGVSAAVSGAYIRSTTPPTKGRVRVIVRGAEVRVYSVDTVNNIYKLMVSHTALTKNPSSGLHGLRSNAGSIDWAALAVPGPFMVANLVLTRPSNTTATITWTAPATAVRYIVRRDGVVVTSSLTDTTFTETVTGDPAYEVTAVDAAGRESVPSHVGKVYLPYEDKFNRTDTAAADLGLPGIWTQPTSDKVQIVSGQLMAGTTSTSTAWQNRNYALLDARTADVDISFDYLAATAGVAYRYVNTSNLFIWTGAGIVEGVTNATGMSVRRSMTAPPVGTRVRIVVAGNVHTVLYDDEVVATYTQTTSNRGTKHGPLVESSGVLDNFFIDVAPPLAPANLTATKRTNAAGDLEALLSWTASTGAVDYAVTVNDAFAGFTGGATTYLDTPLWEGANTYRVYPVSADDRWGPRAIVGVVGGLPFSDGFDRANATYPSLGLGPGIYEQPDAGKLKIVDGVVVQAVASTGSTRPKAVIETGTPDVDITLLAVTVSAPSNGVGIVYRYASSTSFFVFLAHGGIYECAGSSTSVLRLAVPAAPPAYTTIGLIVKGALHQILFDGQVVGSWTQTTANRSTKHGVWVDGTAQADDLYIASAP